MSMNSSEMVTMNHGHHNLHMDDPAKHSEHMALLDLVPTDQATHVAVKSGSWFDPQTWGGGIPGAEAKVWIPQNIQVNYDGVSDAALFTLRVDGQLDFATDVDTHMVLDTFVVAPAGTLTLGTAENPVQGQVQTQILIADNGAIDTVWDPQQLSRGLISHGRVEIHGEEKTSHLKVAVDPLAGSNNLMLESVPENWQVGDRILLTGTRYVPHVYDNAMGGWTTPGSEDEQRVITAIYGNTIALDRPLDYDHTTPRSDLKAYVANQSRNVVIETENAEHLPANQRGHVMLMHSDDVDVRYAEFKELGRTDKSRLLDDFQLDENQERILDGHGNPLLGDRTNIRGRYALHLHRTGVSDDAAPAVLVGNSIDGSPGWGIVQHDSYAVLDNNLTYNVTGSGFVSETGNEIGAWRNNISIRNLGGRIANEKSGTGNQDLGFDGHGFWLQSRLVTHQGNVTAGNRGSGIFYFHRGVDQLKVDADNLPLAAWAKGEEDAHSSDPPIIGFENNEVFASSNGLQVIKNFQRQEHDGRTLLDGFKAWEVAQGTQMQYTAHYTLRDFDLLGAASVTRSWMNNGVHLAQNTEDVVFDRLKVEGFNLGVNLQKELTGAEPLSDWGYVWVEAEVKNNQQDWVNVDAATDRFLSHNDVNEGQLSFELDQANSSVTVTPRDDGYFAVIDGVKTDSLGAIEANFGSELLGYGYDGISSIVADGYYELPGGERGIVVDEYFSDRLTGETRKYSFVLTFADDFWTDNVPNLGPLDLHWLDTANQAGNEILTLDEITPTQPSWVDNSLSPEALDPFPMPADAIVGTANAEYLPGGNGDDYFVGGGGSDYIWAGPGNDIINATSAEQRGDGEWEQLLGDEGADLFILGDALGPYYATQGHADVAYMPDFEAGVDQLFLHGSASDYVLIPNGQGEVWISLTSGESIGGVATDSPISLDQFLYTTDGNVALGGEAPDPFPIPAHAIVGTANAEYLPGGDGDDYFIGRGGSDYIWAGPGDDIINATNAELRGDGEWEQLLGAEGADTFILGDRLGPYYAAQGHADVAYMPDFEAGIDQLVLHGSASDYMLIPNGQGEIWISLTNGESIAGVVTESTLSLNQFQYLA